VLPMMIPTCGGALMDGSVPTDTAAVNTAKRAQIGCRGGPLNSLAVHTRST
jgi:hypothetical protein